MKAAPKVKRLLTDFPYYMQAIFKINPSKDLATGTVPHPAQLDMAAWIQSGPKRRQTRGFRGFAKTMFTAAFANWKHKNDPNAKILVLTAGEDLAKKIILAARTLMNYVWFLKDLTPPERSDLYRDNKDMYDIGTCIPTKDPSMAAAGITGSLPGMRASVLIVDDIETPENSRTKQGRVLLRERIVAALNLCTPTADVIVNCTPQNEETVYDFMVKELGFDARAWPVEYPAPGVTVPFLAPMLQSHMDSGLVDMADDVRPIWPERFGREFIIRERLQKRNYAMQFMLRSDLTTTERYPLRLENFIVYPCHRDHAPDSIAWGKLKGDGPTLIQNIPSAGFNNDDFYGPVFISDTRRPYQGTRAFLDPAGSGDDKMALAIFSQLHGYLWWKFSGGWKGGATTDNLTAIVLTLREHDARELTIETNAGGEYIIPLIEPILRKYTVSISDTANPLLRDFPNGWCCAVNGLHNSKQKELRIIEAFESTINSHRIVLDPTVAANTDTMYQLTHITRERASLKHDDEVDAAGSCIALFKDLLHQDATSISQRLASEQLTSQLARYSHLHQPKVVRWFAIP